MKVILSRKGFDSSYGGIPSPILPDGRLVSFPIPSPSDCFQLADINMPGLDTENLISDLSGKKHSLQTCIHLDPDLDRAPNTRLPGWRPALGQTGNAQSHLRDQNVMDILHGTSRSTYCGAAGSRLRSRTTPLDDAIAREILDWFERDGLPEADEYWDAIEGLSGSWRRKASNAGWAALAKRRESFANLGGTGSTSEGNDEISESRSCGKLKAKTQR